MAAEPPPAESPRASDPAPWTLERKLVLEGQVGVDMPLGVYGLALETDVARGVSLSGGVGMAVINGSDVTPRYALLPRFRLRPFDPWTAISFGLGLSYGKREFNGQGYETALTRLDVEASVERAFSGGLSARAFLGAAHLLSVPASGRGSPEAGTLVWGGVGIGYALVPNPRGSTESSPWVGGWYGWQILTLGAVAALIPELTTFFSRSGDPDRLGLTHVADRTAIGVYLLSGPMVHLAHRRYGRLWASTALRVGCPLVLAVLGANARAGDGGETLALPAAVFGGAVASLIDGLALGSEPARQ